MLMAFQQLLWFWFFHCSTLLTYGRICNNEYSCIHCYITNHTADVLCRGYKSCWYNFVLLSAKTLHCNGGWACGDTESLTARDLQCLGSNSCHNVTNATITRGAVSCGGANSCMGTTFNQIPEYLECMGESSCRDAIIDGASMISFEGLYSGVGASINFGNISDDIFDSLSISFNGYFSGYNATIYCWSGQTCDIKCKGNGCLGAVLLCETESDCTVDCNEAMNISCPYQIFLDQSTNVSAIMFPEFLELPFSSIDESVDFEQLCQSSRASSINTRCVNNEQCEDDTIDLIDEGVQDSICCGADSSCAASDASSSAVLTVRQNYDIFGISNEAATGRNMFGESNSIIHCHGYNGCYQSNFTDADIVYCGAQNGCDEGIFENISTVICSGVASCKDGIFYNPKTIYSTSRMALENSIIYTNEVGNCDTDDNTASDDDVNVDIQLLADNTAVGLVLHCECGNKCNINCGVYGACNGTTLYCPNGNCNVSCDFIDDSTCPLIINSDTTAMPTDSSSLEGNDTNAGSNLDGNNDVENLSQIYSYFLLSSAGVLVLVLCLGCMDGKFIRKNEQYKQSQIIFFGVYSLDFASDVFFAIEIWLVMNGEEENDSWIGFMFPFCCLFLILPMMANLTQLNKEIKKWITDNDTRHILQPWILKHGKGLYLLAIISGSAFSAVELCDSNLFQLSFFSLDLPLRQKQIFKNKRVFSVVFFENIPQIALQIVYLLIVDNGSSSNNIAVISMCFSLLSVILTLFEYNTKKFVFESEYLMVIKFKVDSPFIQNMSASEFRQQISNKRILVNHELAKILNISYLLVEQLKPTVCAEGVLITCHIRCDVPPISAMTGLKKAIATNRLPQALGKVYGLPKEPTVTNLEVLQEGPENKGAEAIATITMQSQSLMAMPAPMQMMPGASMSSVASVASAASAASIHSIPSMKNGQLSNNAPEGTNTEHNTNLGNNIPTNALINMPNTQNWSPNVANTIKTQQEQALAMEQMLAYAYSMGLQNHLNGMAQINANVINANSQEGNGVPGIAIPEQPKPRIQTTAEMPVDLQPKGETHLGAATDDGSTTGGDEIVVDVDDAKADVINVEPGLHVQESTKVDAVTLMGVDSVAHLGDENLDEINKDEQEDLHQFLDVAGGSIPQGTKMQLVDSSSVNKDD